jgi:TRAP-type C4-dicarboxylate transport system permease small subunit
MGSPERDATVADDPRRRPPLVLERLLAGISAIERVVGTLTLAVLLILVLAQAAVRFLPVGGWVWTGELARFCLVWLTFSLSGYLMARDEHITLEVVDLVASGRPLWVVKAFANVVIAVVCAGFAVESLAMVTGETGQASPAMGLPVSLVFVIPLGGFALTGLRAGLAVVWRPPEARAAALPLIAGSTASSDKPEVAPKGPAS